MGIPTLSLLQNITLMKTCQLTLSQLETPSPTPCTSFSPPSAKIALRTRSPVITSPPSPLQYQNDLHTQHYLILAGLPALHPPAPERTFWNSPSSFLTCFSCHCPSSHPRGLFHCRLTNQPSSQIHFLAKLNTGLVLSN